jgi:hypothetical protein
MLILLTEGRSRSQTLTNQNVLPSLYSVRRGLQLQVM